MGLFILAIGSHQRAVPQNKDPGTVVEDRLYLLDRSRVSIEGYVGERIASSISGRLTKSERREDIVQEILKPFRERNEEKTWRGEFWGKWFTSALWAESYLRDEELMDFLDRQVRTVVDTQTEDGYLGTYRERITGRWDLWNSRYTLLGLLEHHRETGNQRALRAAKRYVDYIRKRLGPADDQVPITNVGIMYGIPASDLLEPVVKLYRRTGKKRFLTFARSILSRLARYPSVDPIRRALDGVPMVKAPDPAYHEGKKNDGRAPHAYATMALYDGIAEMYRATGKQKYIRALKKAGEKIIRNEVFITGGVGAHEFYSGRDRQTGDTTDTMETCAGWAWMHLCSNLLRLTGDPRWADRIEQVFYNNLLGAMKPDGTWWTYRNGLAGRKRPAHGQCNLDTMHCCVANGPRAMTYFPALAVMRSARGPVVNMYADGVYDVPLESGKSIELDQQTRYPRSGTVRMTVRTDRRRRFTLRLRIPSWSRRTALSVNGSERSDPEPGSYTGIQRRWKDGDTVMLHLDVRGRVVTNPGGQDHVTVLRGPVVLARDRRIARSHGRETFLRRPVAIKTDKNGYTDLKTMNAPESIWMAYRVPLVNGDREIRMVDYASAGNTWDQRSSFRVWLPAVSNTSTTGTGLVPSSAQARPNEALLLDLQQKLRRFSALDRVKMDQPPSKLNGTNILYGTNRGRTFHGAADGGWIQYRLDVSPKEPVALICRYWGGDEGARTFQIYVDGDKIASERLGKEQPDGFYTKTYPVPRRLTRGKETVTVRFRAVPGNTAGGLYGCWMVQHTSGERKQ